MNPRARSPGHWCWVEPHPANRRPRLSRRSVSRQPVPRHFRAGPLSALSHCRGRGSRRAKRTPKLVAVALRGRGFALATRSSTNLPSPSAVGEGPGMREHRPAHAPAAKWRYRTNYRPAEQTRRYASMRLPGLVEPLRKTVRPHTSGFRSASPVSGSTLARALERSTPTWRAPERLALPVARRGVCRRFLRTRRARLLQGGDTSRASAPRRWNDKQSNYCGTD